MGVKILTVDDSKTIRMIVARAFKSFDCEIMEASNGVEGLAVASRDRPDLIILDVTMPVMDGTEMLSRLKSNPDLKTIPVIMLTAEAGRENVLRIAKMGVRDYLVKPFKEEQILERVGRVVELKNLGGSKAKTRKRFDDPLNIYLADDKSAIVEQLRAGLSDTPWQLTAFSLANQALDAINEKIPDLLLLSLSLPDGSAFWLYQKLRASLKTERLPVFALCVKTALEEQARAQQVGLTTIVTKPIDYLDLKSRISRVLNLDASYKYFTQKDGVLMVNFPVTFNATIAHDITAHLSEKITEAVDAGLDKLIMDLSQLKSVDVVFIELALQIMKLSQDLSLKTGIVGNEGAITACRNYEETKDWLFAGTFEEALQAMSGKPVSS